MPKPDQATVDALVDYEQKKRGHVICGAWKPRKGGVCCKVPMRGRDRCADDGGKSPRGVESPNFKTGLFSTAVMDTPIADSYHRVTHDKRLMDLREHIGLATGILEQQIKEMFSGVPPIEFWQEARRCARDIRRAKGNHERERPHLERLLEIIDEGAQVQEQRADFRRQQDHIRKLNTTERRHLEKERELMSTEAFHVNMRILAEGMRLFFEEAAIMRWRLWVANNVTGVTAIKELPEGTTVSQN